MLSCYRAIVLSCYRAIMLSWFSEHTHFILLDVKIVISLHLLIGYKILRRRL